MDSSEATKTVFSRIQSLDPENASKIMGFIFIQDPGEKEMIRMAFGPEALLVSLINQAKTHLGLSSNTSSTPSAPSMANPNRPNPFPQLSPRIIIPNNEFSISPSSPSSPRSVSGFTSPRPDSFSLSYAAVVNGSSSNGGSVTFSPSICSSLSLLPLYRTNSDLNDGCNYDQLSFLDDSMSKNVDLGDPIMSPNGRSDSMLFPYGNTPHQPFHRRSYSVNDEFLTGGSGSGCGCENGGTGFGWRHCMYFVSGFCKNGDSCKFLHNGFVDSPNAPAAIGGSPSKLDEFDKLLRMKAIQQQRFAAASQLMASAPFPYKDMNFDSQRSAAATLMTGEEFHTLGGCPPEINEFLDRGFGGNADSSSRQIYLTFPSNSTFKEEDVSNYFSNFGPVQDVRIPYQQKRMFGFVTFVYPETVKIILAKGNPHFVCDSRVLVKPYKEKGKISDRKQQQYQLERGEFSSCLSPPGLKSGEQSYGALGATMFYNTKERMLRRKMEEQTDLQHAIELQGRRLMHLQLMDLRNHQLLRHVGSGLPVLSPPHPHLHINPSLVHGSDGVNKEVLEVAEDNSGPTSASYPFVATGEQHEVKEACPTKPACDYSSFFCSGLLEADDNSSVAITTSSSNTPSTSAFNMTDFSEILLLPNAKPLK